MGKEKFSIHETRETVCLYHISLNGKLCRKINSFYNTVF